MTSGINIPLPDFFHYSQTPWTPSTTKLLRDLVEVHCFPFRYSLIQESKRNIAGNKSKIGAVGGLRQYLHVKLSQNFGNSEQHGRFIVVMNSPSRCACIVQVMLGWLRIHRIFSISLVFSLLGHVTEYSVSPNIKLFS